MDKTIIKFKLFMDLEKELSFINRMNRKGFKLIRIKLGCIYEFEKADGKYFTIVHAEEPSKIRSTVKAAKEKGYEVVSHGGDGVREILCFTAKEGEAPKEFANDADSKLRLNECKINALKLPLAIYMVGFFACLICLAFIVFKSVEKGELFGSVTIVCLLSALCVVWAALIIKFKLMIKKLKRSGANND